MKRTLNGYLKNLIENRGDSRVIIIEGARQVGKSYLVNSVLEECDCPVFSYDLEKEATLRRQIASTANFEDFAALMTDRYGLKTNSILFFDEAQECRKLAEYVKSFKEDWPAVKVVLTGSSMNRFFDDSVRIPVGRLQSLCVFGFSFAEYVRFVHGEELYHFLRSTPDKVSSSRHQYLLELYDQYMLVGGYPEAVKAFQKKTSYQSIQEDIVFSLTEDFQRKEAYQPGLFMNSIRAIANHVGSPSKLTHIDATKYHAKNVLEAMKSWHIVIEATPYALDPSHSNFLPKRYLHDIGVLNLFRSLAVPAISLINTIDSQLRTPLGGLFENAVAISLLAGQSAFKSLSTWKESGGAEGEVDFVLDAPDAKGTIPIECKATISVQKRHLKNIKKYLDLTGQSFGVLVTAAPVKWFITEERKRILNLPIYLASRESIHRYYQEQPHPELL